MNPLWIMLAMELIMELAKRREQEQTAKDAIAAAQALKDPQKALETIAANPEARKSVITAAADVIEGLFGKK